MIPLVSRAGTGEIAEADGVGHGGVPPQRGGRERAAGPDGLCRNITGPPQEGKRPRAVPSCLLFLAACAGCLGPRIVASPLSLRQQQQEILEIVPLGTPKAEAEQKLAAAGIVAAAGASERILYCDVWNRPDGERWHIDVALLFDENGLLYEVRRSRAVVEPIPEGE